MSDIPHSAYLFWVYDFVHNIKQKDIKALGSLRAKNTCYVFISPSLPDVTGCVLKELSGYI